MLSSLDISSVNEYLLSLKRRGDKLVRQNENLTYNINYYASAFPSIASSLSSMYNDLVYYTTLAARLEEGLWPYRTELISKYMAQWSIIQSCDSQLSTNGELYNEAKRWRDFYADVLDSQKRAYEQWMELEYNVEKPEYEEEISQAEELLSAQRAQLSSLWSQWEAETDPEKKDILYERISSLEENIYDTEDTISYYNDLIRDLEDKKQSYFDMFSVTQDNIDTYQSEMNDIASSNATLRNTRSLAQTARSNVMEELDKWNDSYYNTEWEISSADCPGYSYSPPQDEEDDDD